jgi:bifunctional DNA-binding transcriptional regulator/antitoxin component of YhaV-PrlF toxin-antitoxin module
LATKTKIQRVDRPTNHSYYAIIPVPIAQACEIEKGEEFEWVIEDKNTLALRRANPKKAKRKTGKN